MPSLPNKSIKGAAFKKWVVESIDKLIDYLSSTYIQVGQGLKIRRSPSGLVIELDKQPGEPQSAAGGGGGTIQDISSTVTGGTASISLSGSTSAVELVGTGAVAISGNTNGQVEIKANGIFPDFSSAPTQSFTLTHGAGSNSFVANENGYLYVYANFKSSVASEAQVDVNVYIGGSTFTVYSLYRNNMDYYAVGTGSCLCMPVLSGTTITGQLAYESGASNDFDGSAVYKFYT